MGAPADSPADSPFDGIWDAFGDAGLLDAAMIDRDGGEPLVIMVDLRTPDEVEFDSRITTHKPMIDYRRVDAPELAVDSTLTVRGIRYRVRNPPRDLGDGVHLQADLEVVR
ncbi:hypothetical protein QYH69_29410 [Paraburkholderia sp. SARCC-3016]|uniref:head-tail joining protein n=1 Tax=Paraburkholderia sp. SARCC-3016 TaxID=3058611 RepID=UPI0028073B5A|nr:hypothetical protein [Paraburkholderia sp. SARCC-3016]MDQ7981354.1 hypothetical protein [Paraburkholderia sp. SARCC-3016]